MSARPRQTRRRPWLGLRTELLIVLPAALLLLVVVSTFTLFSYRGAVLRLVEERQSEATRLARGIADHLVAAGAVPLPAAERLQQLAPGATGAGLLAASGMIMAAAGELPPVALPAAPAARAQPFALGPDADLPDAVAGFAPLVAPPAAGARTRTLLFARVDLPAATLGAQLQAVRRLLWLVLPVNSALVLLVLLFLRHLLNPYDTLLARARQLGQGDGTAEDEGEFLIATLERALEALGERQRVPSAAGDDDDLAALERTLAPSLESGLLLLGRDGRVLSLNAPGAVLLGAVPATAGVTAPATSAAPAASAAPADSTAPAAIAAPAPAPRSAVTALAGPPSSPAATAPAALPPGTTLAELLRPYPEMQALLEAAIARGQPVRRQELTLRRAGTAPVALGMSVHPLRRDDGATRGYLVLFTDLTEARRRAEESLLAERLATLGEMAAGAAHELRNSLATLRGYLTLIERHPDEDSIADFLSEIRHEADHLQRVLEDFLAFARPGTARFQPVALPALVRRAAADPALAGVTVEVREERPGGEAAAGGGTLRGDPLLIERALRNVLHNAAQAEREAGRNGPVEVGIAELPAACEVTVADRGAGVPADLRGRLFHPFATGRAGGVGLGLALAHRIVTLHGGRIRLEDRAGGGTLARLTFARGDSATEGSRTDPPSLIGEAPSPDSKI
jgi:signal transduction histidine kinase